MSRPRKLESSTSLAQVLLPHSRLPKVLQTRLANKPNLTDEHLRDAVLEACALVDEELPDSEL